MLCWFNDRLELNSLKVVLLIKSPSIVYARQNKYLKADRVLARLKCRYNFNLT